MNCPHCKKDLPVNYGGAYCPACGNDLPVSPGTVRPLDPSQKISWPFFFVCLFAPVLLTIFTVLLSSNPGNSILTLVVLSGPISGVICGVMLSQRLGRTTESKVLLGLLLVPVMVVVCVVMNFFGCLASAGVTRSH